MRRRRKKARIAAMPLSRRILRRVLVFGTWILGLIAAFMVVAIVLFYTLTDVPRPESLPLPQVATIEYADGSTLAKIGTVDRTIVPLSQVPTHVRWAVLAAEDRSFYSESVVSIKGTVRAALSDVTGGNTQGGSGITQQYVKNAYLSSSQTLSRKLKELMIAVKLSREYSKNQILEFYLNTVYFGRNTYGIEAASRGLLRHPRAEAERGPGRRARRAAARAGLLRPGHAIPTAAKQRWRYVLDGMVKTGHLTQAQEDALAFPKTKPIHGNGIGVTGWKFLIKQQVHGGAVAPTASAPTRSAQRGLTIRTTINPKAQTAAVSAMTTEFAHLTKKQKNLKHALVAVDPSTGGVLAYYGGTGAGRQGPGRQGRLQRLRQPGRPAAGLVVQALRARHRADADGAAGRGQAALRDQQRGRRQLLPDDRGHQDLQRPGRPVGQRPARQDRQRDEVLAEHDLRPDLPPRPGPDNVADTAHAMGIAAVDSNGTKTLQDKSGSTSFGIGIGDYPVSVLDQASGYATLADNGVRHDPYLVQSATASDGETLFKHSTQVDAGDRQAGRQRRRR